MRKRRTPAEPLPAPWSRPSFWEEVEFEMATVETRDLEEFEQAATGPVDPPPAFEASLRSRLRRLVRSRYPKH